MQQNEDYALGALQEGGLLTRKQIDGARSRLNGEPGVLEVLINDGALSEVDVSRTLAAQAHMDWIDISTMIIPPQTRSVRLHTRCDFFGYSLIALDSPLATAPISNDCLNVTGSGLDGCAP